MLLEKVREYYLEKDYNCAETVLLAANDTYGLGLPADAVRLVSGYGGGFGAKKTCGALCGAMAVLSVMCVGEKAHATEGFGPLCGAFYAAVTERLGTECCETLQGMYRTEENRCLRTVELVAQELEAYLAKLGKIPARS